MEIIREVVLLLLDQDGRILMLSEQNSETSFSEGTGVLSLPTETIGDEEPIKQALVRLIVKKIGNGQMTAPTFHQDLAIRHEDKASRWIRIYVNICDISFDARPQIQNVKFYGWMPPQAIKRLPASGKKPEIDPVIESYFAH